MVFDLGTVPRARGRRREVFGTVPPWAQGAEKSARHRQAAYVYHMYPLVPLDDVFGVGFGDEVDLYVGWWRSGRRGAGAGWSL